jgi:outer membrane lipoprotein SlyB
MKLHIALASFLAMSLYLSPAQAAGCLKGAVVGGLAGHVAHHHAILGAMAGCAIGHHMAVKEKREKAQQDQMQQKQAHGSQGNY